MSDKIKEILSKYKTIAMWVLVRMIKAINISHEVHAKICFKVIPVNPSAKGQKILGEEVLKT